MKNGYLITTVLINKAFRIGVKEWRKEAVIIGLLPRNLQKRIEGAAHSINKDNDFVGVGRNSVESVARSMGSKTQV